MEYISIESIIKIINFIEAKEQKTIIITNELLKECI